MIKHLTYVFLICSCHSTSGSNYTKEIFSDTTALSTVKEKDNNIPKSAKLFDNQQPFEIVSFGNNIDKNTTDTDTTKCNDWKLSQKEIEEIIKHSEQIDGTTWDLTFLVLTCTKSVIIRQDGQRFNIEINAASFFSVNNADTTLLFGDYKRSDRKYFIEGPGK